MRSHITRLYVQSRLEMFFSMFLSAKWLIILTSSSSLIPPLSLPSWFFLFISLLHAKNKSVSYFHIIKSPTSRSSLYNMLKFPFPKEDKKSPSTDMTFLIHSQIPPLVCCIRFFSSFLHHACLRLKIPEAGVAHGCPKPNWEDQHSSKTGIRSIFVTVIPKDCNWVNLLTICKHNTQKKGKSGKA